MRPAFQRGEIETGAREHVRCGRHMAGLGVVGRAGQRQFLGAKPEAVGGAGFDQR